MKKLAIVGLVIVLALSLVGCCTRVDPTTKVSTKTFGNCLTAAQTLLCSPTPAQQAEAQAVLNFLNSGISVAGLVVNVPITPAEVQLIFSVVQQGGCVLATDLQTALAWYASLTATLQAKGVKAVPPPVVALYKW